MIDLGFNVAKQSFFNSKAVMKATTEAERQGLSKMGAFVRTRARSSIRSRKKISNPGQPPSSHTGTLKRFLFFVFDPISSSVVIGPILIGENSKQQSPRPPRALEKGGPVTRKVLVNPVSARKGKPAFTDRQRDTFKRLAKEGRIIRPKAEKQSQVAVYRPRPFMGPALLAEIAAGTLPQQLAGSIRG